MSELYLYNTLSGTIEPFKPRHEKKVQMFVCGPTVYDYVHIGNARTFVFFDVVARYLKYAGYEVDYIQNITDIDNKIIERAEKEGIDTLTYAHQYTAIFKHDMKSLGIISPQYKNATDHIPEVMKQVQVLLDKGNAYVIEGDGIYFDLATFPSYGKLSGRTANMADDAVSRIDDSDKKRNRGDFALWKFAQDNDPSWPAPFGAGRPGWHIEDTAITEKYFGPQYDLHGGGQDLMFPHHEAEIAQQESASGKEPFVKYWMHAAFLINKSTKMSKSIGNFATLHEMLETYPPEVIRFYLLSAHYRSPLDFSDDSLKSAHAAITRISEFKKRMAFWKNTTEVSTADKKILDDLYDGIIDALNTDFDTPKAIGFFFEIIRELNRHIDAGIDVSHEGHFLAAYALMSDVLGIKAIANKEIPEDITRLATERETHRTAKAWPKADEIRVQIEKAGYIIDDTPYGPLITKK